MAINIPTKIIVHHTGGSDANPLQDSSDFSFNQCNELHRVKFDMKSSLGFYIGYHYYIEKNGTLRQGRADTDEGAHTIGQNTSSLGICLAGNFDLTTPTASQITTLASLLIALSDKYKIAPVNIVPHRTFATKTCYGNKLSASWAADLVRNAPKPTPIPVPPPVTNEQKIRQALELIRQAAELVKGI